MDNQAHFLKNLAIMGGLLLLASFGAGAYSIDSARSPSDRDENLLVLNWR